METKSFEAVLNTYGSLFYKSVGVSMRPFIREGRDCIYIKKRPEERLKKYDVVLYKRPQMTGRGEYVLHRILRVHPDGTYWIVGDNCVGGEIVKEENILGVLTAIQRRGLTINVSDFDVRLYTALWCAPYPIRFFILRLRHLCKGTAVKILRCLHLK